MIRIPLAILFCSLCTFCLGQAKSPAIDWMKSDYKDFEIFFTTKDSTIATSIQTMIDKGEKTVTDYFGHPFKHTFSVYIFPSRRDLDLQWQHDYNDTTVHSECWMVASGVGDVLQILSPQVWKTEACEHNDSDSAATQRLLTHELVHVYHGQYNLIHDFTGLDSLAWFIEGVATYVSGQLDANRMSQVETITADGKNPSQLKFFWTGDARYGLAGSMVQYIAQYYGKEKVFEMLKETDQQKILQSLNTREPELIDEWKKSLK